MNMALKNTFSYRPVNLLEYRAPCSCAAVVNRCLAPQQSDYTMTAALDPAFDMKSVRCVGQC